MKNQLNHAAVDLQQFTALEHVEATGAAAKCIDVPFTKCIDVTFAKCIDLPFAKCVDVGFAKCVDIGFAQA